MDGQARPSRQEGRCCRPMRLGEFVSDEHGTSVCSGLCDTPLSAETRTFKHHPRRANLEKQQTGTHTYIYICIYIYIYIYSCLGLVVTSRWSGSCLPPGWFALVRGSWPLPGPASVRRRCSRLSVQCWWVSVVALRQYHRELFGQVGMRPCLAQVSA